MSYLRPARRPKSWSKLHDTYGLFDTFSSSYPFAILSLLLIPFSILSPLLINFFHLFQPCNLLNFDSGAVHCLFVLLLVQNSPLTLYLLGLWRAAILSGSILLKTYISLLFPFLPSSSNMQLLKNLFLASSSLFYVVQTLLLPIEFVACSILNSSLKKYAFDYPILKPTSRLLSALSIVNLFSLAAQVFLKMVCD